MNNYELTIFASSFWTGFKIVRKKTANICPAPTKAANQLYRSRELKYIFLYIFLEKLIIIVNEHFFG